MDGFADTLGAVLVDGDRDGSTDTDGCLLGWIDDTDDRVILCCFDGCKDGAALADGAALVDGNPEGMALVDGLADTLGAALVDGRSDGKALVDGFADTLGAVLVDGDPVGSGGMVGASAGQAPPARSAGLAARLQICETTLQQLKMPGSMAVEAAAS